MGRSLSLQRDLYTSDKTHPAVIKFIRSSVHKRYLHDSIIPGGKREFTLS